jgi:hypothetical protein
VFESKITTVAMRLLAGVEQDVWSKRSKLPCPISSFVEHIYKGILLAGKLPAVWLATHRTCAGKVSSMSLLCTQALFPLHDHVFVSTSVHCWSHSTGGHRQNGYVGGEYSASLFYAQSRSSSGWQQLPCCDFDRTASCCTIIMMPCHWQG